MFCLKQNLIRENSEFIIERMKGIIVKWLFERKSSAKKHLKVVVILMEGNEPFWTLEVEYNEKMSFNVGGTSVSSSYFLPIVSQIVLEVLSK